MTTITIEQIKSNPNLDLSERLSQFQNTGEWTPEQLENFAYATIKQEYEYWANARKNTNERSDEILQSILNGHIPDNIETFEMLCDDPLQVEEYKKYEVLKKKIADNNGITNEDFEKLCSTVGFDSDTVETIRNEFNQRGLIVEEYKNTGRHI